MHVDVVGTVPIDLQAVELAAPVACPAASGGALVEGVLGLLDDQGGDPLRQRKGIPAAPQQGFKKALIITLLELRPIAVQYLLDALFLVHRRFARLASGSTFSCETMLLISVASLRSASAFSSR